MGGRGTAEVFEVSRLLNGQQTSAQSESTGGQRTDRSKGQFVTGPVPHGNECAEAETPGVDSENMHTESSPEKLCFLFFLDLLRVDEERLPKDIFANFYGFDRGL